MALETGIDAAEGWRIARQNAGNLKKWLTDAHFDMANEDTKLESIIQYYKRMRDHKIQLLEMAALPNINAFVSDMRQDPTYVATDQITAVTDAIDVALTWIDTNAAGLSLTGDTAANAIANGSIVTNRFTPAQTAGLRTAIAAIGAAINS